jgi:DNA polymerase
MENAVSGMCRDIMATALLAVEKKGYCPVLQVHDEIVVEVPERQSISEVEAVILESLPAWAKDFPLGVESWEGKRYRK